MKESITAANRIVHLKSGIDVTMNVKKCTIPAADEYPRKRIIANSSLV
jgi:hypothetical protein